MEDQSNELSHEQGQDKGDDQEPVLNWFHRKWHNVFMKLDKRKIVDIAKDLAEEFPDETKEKLAKRVLRRSARQAGVVGLASATPALIPGIGTAVSIVGIVPEEYYLMRKQCQMVLEIAAIFGYDVANYERLYEIITLIGTPSRSIEVLMVAKYDFRRMAAKAAIHFGSKTGRRTLLGLKAASRGTVKRLPAIGFFAGGAINYYTFRSLGKKAVRFYGLKSKQEEKNELLPKKEGRTRSKKGA